MFTILNYLVCCSRVAFIRVITLKRKSKNVLKRKNMTKIESLFIERGSRAILNICNVLK